QGCRKDEELAGSVEKRGDGDPGGVHGVVGILLLAPAIPAPVAVLSGEERARSAANEIVVPLRAAGAAERIHDLAQDLELPGAERPIANVAQVRREGAEVALRQRPAAVIGE